MHGSYSWIEWEITTMPILLRFAVDFSTLLAPDTPNTKENDVARKTILVCDNCGKEVPESRGAVMRLNYTDARRGSKQADLCDDCASGMPGHAVARRGRRPKSVAGQA
jgi:ribosomal protein S26